MIKINKCRKCGCPVDYSWRDGLTSLYIRCDRCNDLTIEGECGDEVVEKWNAYNPENSQPASMLKEVLNTGSVYYKEGQIEPAEFISSKNLDFFEGCAVKYICRHRQKGGAVDVAKAIHYLLMVLAREYSEADPILVEAFSVAYRRIVEGAAKK